MEIIKTISDVKKVYVNYDDLGVSDIQVGDFTIPTDRYGRSIVNFRGGERSFLYLSALKLFL